MLAEGGSIVSPYIDVSGKLGFRYKIGFFLQMYLNQLFCNFIHARFLGAAIYIILLFVVVLVLSNLLIAQFSSTYEEGIERAPVSVTLSRAKILTRMWRWLACLVKLNAWLQAIILSFYYYYYTFKIIGHNNYYWYYYVYFRDIQGQASKKGFVTICINQLAGCMVCCCRL